MSAATSHNNGGNSDMVPVCANVLKLLVRVKAFRPSQQFFSHVGTFSWGEPVLSNEDKVSLKDTKPCSW